MEIKKSTVNLAISATHFETYFNHPHANEFTPKGVLQNSSEVMVDELKTSITRAKSTQKRKNMSNIYKYLENGTLG